MVVHSLVENIKAERKHGDIAEEKDIRLKHD